MLYCWENVSSNPWSWSGVRRLGWFNQSKRAITIYSTWNGSGVTLLLFHQPPCGKRVYVSRTQLGTQLDVLSCLSRPSQNEYLNPNGPNTNDVVIKPILNPLGNNPVGDAFNPSQNSLQANSRPKIHPNQRHTQNHRFLSKCSLW